MNRKPARGQALALSAALTLALAAPAQADAPAPAPAVEAITGFDGDWSWLNGSNYQPSSLLTMGPLTWTLMVDSYYGYSFNRPADHTVFPTTTAPRHNEFNLNLGLLGLEVTEYKHIFGKLVLQTGNYVDAITGTDATVTRGAYSSMASLRHVQQAYAGHRFDVLNGLNLVAGIFPAYIGMDGYIPQENWAYTHNLLGDFTPYYLSGLMAQLYPRKDLKTELWLVNGWQSLSKYGEGFGYGYSVNWRPHDRLSLTTNFLGGNFEADQTRTRLYSDHVLQWKYAVGGPDQRFKHLAIGAAADIGYNTASTLPGGAQATPLGGFALMHRAELNDQWAATLRGSTFYDPQGLVALALPGGGSPPAGLQPSELTACLDYKPSPWVLYRLEYRHDMANVPYIAGPGGITAPAGATNFTPDFRTSGDRLTANATVRF
jgi:hypothetical protein